MTASVVYDALRGLGADNPILPARIRCLTGPVPLAGRIFTVAGRERLGDACEARTDALTGGSSAEIPGTGGARDGS